MDQQDPQTTPTNDATSVDTTTDTPDQAQSKASTETQSTKEQTAPSDTDNVPKEGLGEEKKESSDDSGDTDEKAHASIGAPEGDYDFTKIELPEGSQIDEDLVSEFSKVAKELDLSQSAAETLVQKVGPAFEKAQKARIDALGQQWLKEAFADPDMGGSKWESTMSDANAAFNKFANPQVRQLLVATGLSKNADVIRMFRDIGRATGTDPMVTGKPAHQKEDPLKYVYNNSNMQ